MTFHVVSFDVFRLNIIRLKAYFIYWLSKLIGYYFFSFQTFCKVSRNHKTAAEVIV